MCLHVAEDKLELNVNYLLPILYLRKFISPLLSRTDNCENLIELCVIYA